MLVRLGKIVLKIIAFIFLVLFTTEVILVIYVSTHKDDFSKVLRYEKEASRAIFPIWRDRDRHLKYALPKKLFSNNLENIGNSNGILESAIFAPNTTYEFIDFLVPIKEKTYHVNTNMLGFRGNQRSLKKNANTIRIMCLGAYETFGLGVNDEKTYTTQLEKKLKIKGKKIEVWNFGLPSQAAITGLATLILYLDKIRPDFVVMEYGFVDGVMFGNNLMPAAGVGIYDYFHFLSRFYIGTLLVYKLSSFLQESSIFNYSKVMNQIINILDTHKVKKIVLGQQISMIPKEWHVDFSKKNGADYIDVKYLFNKKRDDCARWKRSIRGANLYRNPCLINLFHPNAFGYSLIADAIAKKIQTYYLH